MKIGILLKRSLGAGFTIGMLVEMIVQVFHRILDLKHSPGFLPGALNFVSAPQADQRLGIVFAEVLI